MLMLLKLNESSIHFAIVFDVKVNMHVKRLKLGYSRQVLLFTLVDILHWLTAL